MAVESVQCPQCGAPLGVEPGREHTYCSYCGAGLKLAVGVSGHPMAVLDDIKTDTSILAKEATLKHLTELQELLSSTQPPRLDEMYSFRDATSVHNYLKIHPNLIGRLTEAHSQLQKYFGSERTIVLQVVKDPEAEDSQQLFAFVRASISVEAALAQLDRFDEEWFLDHLEEFGGNFNVEVEFV